MGVTITANNSKHEFDMGAGGFFNLRKNIALALDNDFGLNYAEIISCQTKEQHGENDKKAEQIINEKNLEEKYSDVLDFLYMSDCDGKIGYRTCRKIADLIEPCMPALKTKTFRYAIYAKNDYEEFLVFLRECVRYRRNMTWY